MKKKTQPHVMEIAEEKAIELVAEACCEVLNEEKSHASDPVENYIQEIRLKIFINAKTLKQRCRQGYHVIQEELGKEYK